jgi:hypothetical protein
MRLVAFLAVAASAAPHITRVAPLGGQTGAVVEVELHGKDLAGFRSARFDTAKLTWIETTETKAELVRGRVRIDAAAALGPHRMQAVTANGVTNTRLFNVFEFEGVNEVEPNDKTAQTIALKPQVVHGFMKTLADVDSYSFDAKAGERWVFDLRSIERGGFLECSLTLYDEAGREAAFNEDQDEYLETPRLSVTFPKTGRYTLKVDQYRGPQGVSCAGNCGYALHISQLPVVRAIFPLGAKPGAAYNVRLLGEALDSVTGAFLQRARGAEHYRLTFPFSMPIDGSDKFETIDAIAVNASEARFQIPPTATPGLWRLWLRTKHGTAEAMSVEISGDAIDAVLTGNEHSYDVQLEQGKPFHAWTLATQLGLPTIDTVLELFSAEGKLLAEHDDLMTGQGTVIGNPDSSLYYTPKKTETAKLVVRDRTSRTGSEFAYRLHFDNAAPSFQLLAEPEELSAKPGETVTLEALLIKQPGFESAVDVWIEGHPEARGQFRADQHFGPSGDGDNINIPTVPLRVSIPKEARPGDYEIKLRAQAAGKQGPVVDGISTLWIGPNGKRNDTRRPLPRITIHVIAPTDSHAQN